MADAGFKVRRRINDCQRCLGANTYRDETECNARFGRANFTNAASIATSIRRVPADRQDSLTYQLLDFGDARKLERIAGRLVDRPSPAASNERKSRPLLWKQAESRFDPASKRWHHRTPWPDDLQVDCRGFLMPVQPTPYGHIGLFPEQSHNWKWLQTNQPKQQLRQGSTLPLAPEQTEPAVRNTAFPKHESARRGLNLFGYTGASTIAMAMSGLEVAHVDAARPNVAAARRAANLNHLGDWPIRYLVDDAAKFAAREVRRERMYQTIVLDPPAYGHSPKGKAWRIERDIWPLLSNCLELLDTQGGRLLVTGHSPEITVTDIADTIATQSAGQIETGRSQLVSEDGRPLDAGFFVRFVASSPS